MWQVDRRSQPSTAQSEIGRAAVNQQAKRSPLDGVSPEKREWVALAQSAYHASTSYVDSNYRKAWEDSIRAFNNQHPTDSKYNSPSFEKRSKIFRPKTRASIRKTEAAGAAAFFSNMDVITCTPTDQSNKMEVASADVMKNLLQHRLTKDIPWFLIVQGGLQDAQVTAACAHIYWDYKEEAPKTAVEIQHEEFTPVDPDHVPGVTLDKPQMAMGLMNPAIAQAVGPQPAPQPAPMMQPRPAQMPPPMPQAGPAQLPPQGVQPAPAPNPEYPAQMQLPPGAMQALANNTLSGQPVASITQIKEEPLPPKVLSDKPVIDLIPVENLRIDPGSNWMDPVNSSPYIIHLMPMYVQEVKDRMNSGEWELFDDAAILAATEATPDSTRASRQKDRQDPYTSGSNTVNDYETVWVQRHIHRRDGEDWEFYMLGDVGMLTDPIPLKKSVLHGKRPYVIGTTVIETHKIFPSSIPQLSKEVQSEINQVTNQRLDNVALVLNKKYLVKRGRDADVQGLLRNVPGGIVMLDNPQEDVRELTWQDVTASSFQEHQGLSMEMDELLGNFNPAQLMAAGGANNPARNMAMLAGASGTLVEYGLRTYVETFVQPVLRQLVLLEQHYETDQTIMAIAAKKAQLFQKFGINQLTDDLLKQELTITVNVGMGSTDPMAKLNRFMSVFMAYTNMLQKPAPGVNMKEVGTEMFGFMGYQDGERFFTNENPQVLAMQQQIQQMTGVISQLQAKIAEKKEANQIALQKTNMTAQASVQRQMIGDQTKKDIAAVKEQGLNQRALATHWTALHMHHNAADTAPQPMRFDK